MTWSSASSRRSLAVSGEGVEGELGRPATGRASARARARVATADTRRAYGRAARPVNVVPPDGSRRTWCSGRAHHGEPASAGHRAARPAVGTGAGGGQAEAARGVRARRGHGRTVVRWLPRAARARRPRRRGTRMLGGRACPLGHAARRQGDGAELPAVALPRPAGRGARTCPPIQERGSRVREPRAPVRCRGTTVGRRLRGGPAGRASEGERDHEGGQPSSTGKPRHISCHTPSRRAAEGALGSGRLA